MRRLSTTAFAALAAFLLGSALFPFAAIPTAFAEEGKTKDEVEKTKLGRQQIAGYTVSVIMIGDPHVQETVEFDVKLIDAKDDPKSMRIWIGAESASEKVAMQKKTTTYGATVKVPSPLPEDAKVWVEVETESTTAKASYSMEHEHKH